MKTSRDNSGKLRVAKGDKTGLGGQYAPDAQKLDAAKQQLEGFRDGLTVQPEVTGEPWSKEQWKQFYPTPVFREFDSVDVTVAGEDYYSDDLYADDDKTLKNGVNEFLAEELTNAIFEYDQFEISLIHVPNHVEPDWNHKLVAIPNTVAETNRGVLTGEDSQVLKHVADTVNTHNVETRETEGYVQVKWSHVEPFPMDEYSGAAIMSKVNHYNTVYQNVNVFKKPGDNNVYFSGWYTLSDSEKEALGKLG